MPKKKVQPPHTAETKKKISATMTAYKPEYADKLIEFFNVEPTEKVELPHYGNDGEVKWNDIKLLPRPLPTFVRFAMKICGVSYQCFNGWVDKKNEDGTPAYPELVHSYTQVKELQKDCLIQGGLMGVYNSGFATFVAKNITDMKDETGINVKMDELTDFFRKTLKYDPTPDSETLSERQGGIVTDDSGTDGDIQPDRIPETPAFAPDGAHEIRQKFDRGSGGAVASGNLPGEVGNSGAERSQGQDNNGILDPASL